MEKLIACQEVELRGDAAEFLNPQRALEYPPMSEEEWRTAIDKCNEWAVAKGRPTIAA